MSAATVLAIAGAVGAALTVAMPAHADDSPRANAAEWCVTKGHIKPMPDGRARIEEPKVRAVVPRSDGNDVEIRFDYEGPSAETARLGSGELRRQIGLKLRAENGCNLVYVMWRIEPRAELVVSTKLNPGKRTHRECGTSGYRNLKPAKVAAALARPMAMAPGTHHALHAVLTGRTLRVWADKTLAWEGEVDADALHGPAGVRTDNARFTVEVRAKQGSEGACRPGESSATEAGDED